MDGTRPVTAALTQSSKPLFNPSPNLWTLHHVGSWLATKLQGAVDADSADGNFIGQLVEGGNIAALLVKKLLGLLGVSLLMSSPSMAAIH